MIKKITLSLLTIILLMSNTVVNVKAEVEVINLDDELKSQQYEIYPIPHSTKYDSKTFVVRDQINAILSEKLDGPTLRRFNNIMESKKKSVSYSETLVSDKTNVVLGIYNENEASDKYIIEKYKIDETLFEKNNSYYLSISSGEIAILGQDTDAVFYGLTTLMHIFNQMESSTISQLVIEDYADTKIRGFIEGYYGIPWTNEDRISLMEFAGDFKATSYMFAPKNDPYHTSKWRELYPEDQLEGIREMVEVGSNSKTNFVWTAHPFMGGFNANDVEGEIEALINKFEQLYSLGVRQFGILGDDVGSLDLSIVVRIMNELSEWGREKGDLYDFVFCPAGYNTAWANWEELNTYDLGFPNDVQIFWTGDTVCAPITVSSLNNFRKTGADDERRSPLFWLNWPVNDINMNRLMMGKGSMLHADVEIDDLVGVVTNPMQDAEPSKVAIFAIADYAWNVKSFNDDQSWRDSFKYIDADANEELFTLAQHMSDPAPNGHKLVLEESEDLAPLLEAFNTALESKNFYDTKHAGETIIKKYNKIIEDARQFLSRTKNERMKEQMTPFANSLLDLVESSKAYIESAIAILEQDNSMAWDKYSFGMEYLEKSNNHNRPTRSGVTKALPGSKRIRPFTEDLAKILEADINKLIGENEKLVLTVESNLSKYQGELENVIDNNPSTFYWSNMYEKEGQYIQVNMSIPSTIYGVDILNGTKEKPQDTFGVAKIQYTTDGVTWIDLSDKAYGPYEVEVSISDIEVKDVVAVRYISIEALSGRKWPAMREFKIHFDKNSQNNSELISTMFTSPEWGIYEGAEGNLFDDKDSTGIWYHVRYNNSYGDKKNSVVAGDVVGVELSRSVTLGEINIMGGKDTNHGDYLKNFDLEYSLDGINYTKHQSYKNARDIKLDLSDLNIKAKYVRLKATKDQPTWVGFNTFIVKEKEIYNGVIYTNKDSYKDKLANYTLEQSVMQPQSFTLAKDEYVGLKLSRIRDVISVDYDLDNMGALKLEGSENSYEWFDIDVNSKDRFNARYIRLINTGESVIDFNLSKFEVNSFEYCPFDIIDTNYTSVYQGSVENLFDNDWTTPYHLSKAQTKGDYFIIDLGQDLDLDSLKIVNEDSSIDYIRDAVVRVSSDLDNWSDPIIAIGDQLPNTEDDKEMTMNDSFPDHEISYNTISANGINKNVRYIKLEITQDYKKRWVRLNEIEINGGAYVPNVNNPTFKSTSEDTFNGFFENLTDGSVMTSFIPKDVTGSLTVSISDDHDHNNIKIVRDNNFVNRASASLRVLDTNTNEIKELGLGSLSQSINDFRIEEHYIILNVVLEWLDGPVGFVELIRNKSEFKVVNKMKLKELVNERQDVESWTSDTIEVYENYLVAAQDVIDSDYSTQESVDGLVNSLESAISNKLLKGNVTDLQKLIDERLSDAENYTLKTWRVYNNAIESGLDIINKADNKTQEQIDAVIENITSSINALEYNARHKELLIVEVEDMEIFVKHVNTIIAEDITEVFTRKSYAAFIDAMEKASNLISDTSGNIIPEEYKVTLESLKTAKQGLISTLDIHQYVEEFNIFVKEHYSIETFEAYEEAILALKALYEDGEIDTITAAIEDVKKAREKLEFSVSKESVEALMESLKALDETHYTEESYKALLEVLDLYKEEDLSLKDVEELLLISNSLSTAKEGLVDITGLNTTVLLATQYDESLYTSSTYKFLKAYLENVEKEQKTGTEESIAQLIKNLNESIDNLKLRVNIEVVQAYLDTVTLLDKEMFEDISYQEYLLNYEVLKSIIDDNSDISHEDFLTLQEQFENAKESLIKKVSLLELDKLETVLLRAKAYDSRKYTLESYEVLKVLIDEADQILKTIDSFRTLVTQDEVDDLVLRLERAMNNLVEKEDSIDNGKTDNDNTENIVKPTTPTTGINNLMPMYSVILILGMLSIVLIRKRKIH